MCRAALVSALAMRAIRARHPVFDPSCSVLRTVRLAYCMPVLEVVSMCQEILCQHDGDADPSSQPSNGPNGRAFLRTAGLAGAGVAGAAALGVATVSPASAAGATAAGRAGAAWNPDPDSSRFTLAVMPDTQFLYWGSQGSVNPEPQEESFRYIIANSGKGSADNIVFMAHLGDLTEAAQASSFSYVN